MKSIISASMHKAGSTIMDRILFDFLTEKGYEIDRISHKVPKSPLTEEEVFLKNQEKMKLDGVYYGIARGPYISKMDVIRKLKVIAQVRDPRDCITSAYFSFKVSHKPPADPKKQKAFLERRQHLENLDIDEYALAQVTGYKFRMQVLRNITESHEDALLLKYENMVLDTEKWLDQIADFVDQPMTESLRERIGEKIDFTVSTENVTKHKRQVTPGDHKRKLKPETIETMTEQLREELDFFQYET